LGSGWQALGYLWLCTETALAWSGRADLTFAEICNLSIPDDWKDWMYAKLMRTDATCPVESFGKVFTDYLNGLPSSAQKLSGIVINKGWSHLGKTDIVGLTLCLYWRAEYTGAWERLAGKYQAHRTHLQCDSSYSRPVSLFYTYY
jgi:hypothetical protein